MHSFITFNDSGNWNKYFVPSVTRLPVYTVERILREYQVNMFRYEYCNLLDHYSITLLCSIWSFNTFDLFVYFFVVNIYSCTSYLFLGVILESLMYSLIGTLGKTLQLHSTQ